MTGDRSMTLDERIEAAAREASRLCCDGCEDQGYIEPCRADLCRCRAFTNAALKAAFPELFTTPPTAWIAPWEATDEMVRACLPESLGEIIERGFEEDFAFMRDAHLKANAPQG